MFIRIPVISLELLFRLAGTPVPARWNSCSGSLEFMFFRSYAFQDRKNILTPDRVSLPPGVGAGRKKPAFIIDLNGLGAAHNRVPIGPELDPMAPVL